MKNTLFILTFVISLIGFSQNTISGTVMDGEFNEPLPFATVMIKETGEGTTTDFDGVFSIDVRNNSYTLIFSFVGYYINLICT